MRTLQGFLVLLVVLIVSGEDELVNVIAGVKEDVLLKCSCEGRNSNEEFKWQKENVGLVWRKEKGSNTYVGRVETFLNNSNNCSLLLKNITEADNGTYGCRFYIGSQYMKKFVVLTVYELNKPSQRSFNLSNGATQIECDVKSRGDIELQWTLDGKILENSSSNIFRNHKEQDGIFHITSTLQMNQSESSSISKLLCDVQLPQAGFVIVNPTERPMTVPSRSRSSHYLVIPVLGFSLTLCVLYANSKRKNQGDVGVPDTP